MEDFVRFAVAKGVKKYGFSSHAPLPFQTAWNMNQDDFPYYKQEFYRLKEKYKPDLELFLGLEVDYIESVFDAKSDLYDTSDFDYRIGSVHYLDPLPDGGFFSVDGKLFNFQKRMDEIYRGDYDLNLISSNAKETSRTLSWENTTNEYISAYKSIL